MIVRHVVVGFEPPPDLADRIKDLLQVDQSVVTIAPTSEALHDVIGDADVLFGGILTPDLVEKAVRLKWLQTPSAGVKNVATPQLANSTIVVTNASETHATQISEHILAMMLAFARDLPQAVRAQDQRQ